ncbi:hypothetical protein BDK51DRAFT_28270 [Blyttiomyces helicus]|uniref:Heme haloperoxidase family profile domain-containing protein n=1 Tax=Blyttiomyces helicus TaxID=388810 RepID=A0A4P9WJU6_9FUNG|nr:hypothetical protein BDK51DRAFT_28270 [Blyttiomyces helicus]|eukprot:RKO92345.1 hypothetical protein BDK51DRAFT_28270 [Blyttiomyces helicus]
MLTKTVASLAILATSALAQVPICSKYATALNITETQLVEDVLVLALLGNTTANPPVAGILASSSPVLNFFNGAGLTTNRNNQPTSVNFLDGGGAASLQNGTLGTTGSNQLTLANHLVEYVGFLLNCNETFPVYTGNPNMYAVHKFMNISQTQFTYFDTAIENATKMWDLGSWL